MDTVTLIRIGAGILAVLVVVLLLWRRRRHASE